MSIFKYGEIVSALRLSEIDPRVPAFGKSAGSLALAISSSEHFGVAKRIDWKLPNPCDGEKVTLKVYSDLQSMLHCLGVISKADP